MKKIVYCGKNKPKNRRNENNIEKLFIYLCFFTSSPHTTNGGNLSGRRMPNENRGMRLYLLSEVG